MARLKIRRTDERDLAIMDYYDKVNAELGALASSVSMRKKYTMVGDHFFLAPKTVANIISRMTHAGYKREIQGISPGE